VSVGFENEGVAHIHRQIRLVGILSAAEAAGLVPMPAQQLHAVGYFADALAPVWGLRILDAQVLKLEEGPTSPLLQADLDRLVGMGVVVASAVRHVENSERLWRLDADYSLNQDFSQPILDKARSFERYSTELNFLREVVFALSGLGAMGIISAGNSDASYGNEMVGPRGMVDIAGRESEVNPTARVALRFKELMHPNIALSDAEMIHLYVRELYNRLEHDE
jgi:hypothetical protein